MIHTLQSPSVFYCGIFHLQNIFQCICILYNLVLFAVFFTLIFRVSHLINKDNTNAFCIITKYLLFCKTFKLAPAKRECCSTYQLMSQCCPLMPVMSVTFLTSTCFLSLSNCKTALGANSMSLKDLISGYV